MAIQTLYDTGDDHTVMSKYDGAVYATAVADCVCQGIGDEFAINYAADSLNVSFNAGSQAIIGGGYFKVKSTESITLSPNTTIYLCANIDLSKPNGQTGSFVQRTASNMQSGNLNGSGTSRDLLLYTLTTSGTGVTAVTDKKVIKGNGSAISGLGLVTCTQAQYDALETKDANTLYFITE